MLIGQGQDIEYEGSNSDSSF
jgi:hypothetical protein